MKFSKTTVKWVIEIKPYIRSSMSVQFVFLNTADNAYTYMYSLEFWYKNGNTVFQTQVKYGRKVVSSLL